MMPFQIVSMWFRGLLSVILLVAGPYLVYRWYCESQVRYVEEAAAVTQSVGPDGRVALGPRVTWAFEPQWGFNWKTAMLIGGVVATLWAFPKGPLQIRRLLRRRGADEPQHCRGGEVVTLTGEGGETLHVEIYGPVDAPPVVLTHGWGLDGTAWYYLKKAFAGRFRLIVWDLPGLGLSKRPADRDYSLERLAGNLKTVIGVAAGRPVVLVGHSIGGMIMLTFAKRFPAAIGTLVSGMVLTHTTYTNPVKTAKGAAIYTALQGLVLVPMLYLTIALSPLVWLMNLMSYLNGSEHRSNERTSFTGKETRGQLDFAASFTPRASPAVLARGMLGMLKYDATSTLKGICVPVLVVAGDKDPICSPEASERMRREIPMAEMITLSSAKHLGMVEHHDRYIQAVGEFIGNAERFASHKEAALL